MQTQTFNHKVKFQVSLSNGETFYEGKGEYQDFQDGRPSPWNRLLRYIVDNGLDITSISLYTDDGQRFNLPTSGHNPKFREFDEAEKPIDYNFGRKMAREADAVRDGRQVKLTSDWETSDWYTFIEAIYTDYRMQLWVDENNPKICWTLLKKN